MNSMNEERRIGKNSHEFSEVVDESIELGETRNFAGGISVQDYLRFNQERNQKPSTIQHYKVSLKETQHEGEKPSKSYCIIGYTVATCLSCLYLEIAHFSAILDDKRALYLDTLSCFNTFMILLSYFQTISIPAFVRPLQNNLPPHQLQNQKFFDLAYSSKKKCQKCLYFKTARVSHCQRCQKCVYKLDHHCIWAQTCIGYSNQKSFNLFIVYLSIGVCQFCYYSLLVISLDWDSDKRIGRDWGMMTLWALTSTSVVLVGIMILYLLFTHSVNLCYNHTTLDGIKQHRTLPRCFGIKDSEINLFDRGCIQNMKAVMGDNILTCWVPLEVQVVNEACPEPMTAHPSPLQLMKHSNLYEEEMKYEMCLERAVPQLKKLLRHSKFKMQSKYSSK